MRPRYVDISQLITPAQAGALIGRNRVWVYDLIKSQFVQHEFIADVYFVYRDDILRWGAAWNFKQKDFEAMQHLSISEASAFMACSMSFLKNNADTYGAFLENGALRFDKDILMSKVK